MSSGESESAKVPAESETVETDHALEKLFGAMTKNGDAIVAKLCEAILPELKKLVENRTLFWIRAILRNDAKLALERRGDRIFAFVHRGKEVTKEELGEFEFDESPDPDNMLAGSLQLAYRRLERKPDR